MQRKQRPLPNGGRGMAMSHFFEKKFLKKITHLAFR